LTYTTGSLPRQVGSAWKTVFKLSLPNDFKVTNLLRRRRPAAAERPVLKAA
jgi:linoleoyl-CoA desaturase